jgi:hypothetical protein
LVTGSLPHPTFTPDPQASAKRNLNNLLPTACDPAKLTGGLLGQKGARGISKGVLGAGSEQQQPRPANSTVAETAESRGFAAEAIAQNEETVLPMRNQDSTND